MKILVLILVIGAVFGNAYAQVDCSPLAVAARAGIQLIGSCGSGLTTLGFTPEEIDTDDLDAVCTEDCGGEVYREYLETCGDDDNATAYAFALRDSCSQNGVDDYCFNVFVTLQNPSSQQEAALMAACGTAMPGNCSDECRIMLQGLVTQAGCCIGNLNESMIPQITEDTNVVQLFTLIEICNIPIPDTCISPFEESSDEDGDGGTIGITATKSLVGLILLATLAFLFC